MDNQEAIEIIKLAQAQIEWEYPMDYAVAFDMAISALQAQDSETRRICDTCKYDPPSKKWPCVDCDMRDPADRWDQQELSKNSTELDKKNGELQPTCNQLATDTISRQAIINSFRYDDDGTAWDMDDIVYRLEQFPSAQPEPCEDAVSRKSILDKISKKDNWEKYDRYNLGLSDARRIVQDEPSVTPKRKTGKWLDAVLPNDNGGLPVEVCDQCNTFFPLAFIGGELKFRPNCGADMRGDNE